MRKAVVVLLLVISAAYLFSFCNNAAQPAGEAASISPDSLVKRGAYLVSIMGCYDCHSPKIMGPSGPQPDPERLLSGHPADMPLAPYDTIITKNWVLFNMIETAYVGPWGVSYSANLTSDSTGIGGWTEEQFFKAIREGKSKGLDNNRPILPPMPWPTYSNASDEDLKAIFAFLKSTKPVKNVVPPPVMAPPPTGAPH